MLSWQSCHIDYKTGDKMISIGYMSVISMASHVIFIYITWMAMQSINVDFFVNKDKIKEARILMILITIAVGVTVSNFVLDLLSWSQDLIFLF